MTTHRIRVSGFAVCAMIATAAALPATSSAEVIGDCSLTGYTFMGGGSAYTSTPDGPASQKDYFLAQPLNYDYSGSNLWGYGWVKFDNLSAAPVESAHLVFDLLGVGAMAVTEATPENPGELDIYTPGGTDVADLGGSASLRAALRDALDGADDGMLDSLTMDRNGAWSIDITDLYNDWVSGTAENNGLVFVSGMNINGNLGTKYAGFDNEGGLAPYISTTPVPEPTGLGLLVFGALCWLGRRGR